MLMPCGRGTCASPDKVSKGLLDDIPSIVLILFVFCQVGVQSDTWMLSGQLRGGLEKVWCDVERCTWGQANA